MKLSLLNKITKDISRDFGDNYIGEINLKKVLDTSRLKDDPDALIEEMIKQPATYAFWANLKNIAEEKYKEAVEAMEVFKASKTKKIIQILTAEGSKAPTGKMIEAAFHREYRYNEQYLKRKEKIDIWRKKRDKLIIAEKSVASREVQFRSLSYLMSNMMNSGLMPAKKLKPKTHKMKE